MNFDGERHAIIFNTLNEALDQERGLIQCVNDYVTFCPLRLTDDFLISITTRYLPTIFGPNNIKMFNIAELAQSARPLLEGFVENVANENIPRAQLISCCKSSLNSCYDDHVHSDYCENLALDNEYKMFWEHYPMLENFTNMIEKFYKFEGRNKNLTTVLGVHSMNIYCHWTVLQFAFELN